MTVLPTVFILIIYIVYSTCIIIIYEIENTIINKKKGIGFYTFFQKSNIYRRIRLS